MVRRPFTILGTLLVAASACADDVTWRPAAPLLLNLSQDGELVEPGRGLDWSSPKGEPAAGRGARLDDPRGPRRRRHVVRQLPLAARKLPHDGCPVAARGEDRLLVRREVDREDDLPRMGAHLVGLTPGAEFPELDQSVRLRRD